MGIDLIFKNDTAWNRPKLANKWVGIEVEVFMVL